MQIISQPRTDALMPTADVRHDLFEQAISIIEGFYSDVDSLPASPQVSADEIRQYLSQFTFETSLDAKQVLDGVSRRLRDWNLHVPHPRYYGLFNPAPGFYSVLADLLVAAFNPQLGAWHHNPFGVEIERHVVRYFAQQFGIGTDAFGNFTSGGSEANYTATLVALTRKFPTFAKSGVRSLDGQPVFYCSTEFHHSFEKIAHQCGLGRDAVRLVPVTDEFVMDIAQAATMIEEDRRNGLLPFMINATAGTTNSGLLEPLESIAHLAQEHNLHLHVDAAWGGPAILSDKHKSKLAGIEHADSITFDPHKLLSVPMAAGIVLVREHHWLHQAFALKTDYVPESQTAGLDNYQLSFQFSRRFIGLKLFIQLAVLGKQDYEKVINHQFEMAHLLAKKLEANDYRVLNGASMGVVCFAPQETHPEGQDDFQWLADGVCQSGEAWISTTKLGGHPVLRACITNHLTQESDLDRLVDVLNRVRDAK